MEAWWKLTASGTNEKIDLLDGFAIALGQDFARTESQVGPATPADFCPPPIPSTTMRLAGNVQPESWCRLGTHILPKLAKGTDVKLGVDISFTVESGSAGLLEVELRHILANLGLTASVHLET